MSPRRAEGVTLPANGRIKYAGRPPSASTATGYGKVHEKEQLALVSDALNLSY
jgi:2-oxoglutarate dehydrogenase E1 component